jgi:hypothetical protein
MKSYNDGTAFSLPKKKHLLQVITASTSSTLYLSFGGGSGSYRHSNNTMIMMPERSLLFPMKQ